MLSPSKFLVLTDMSLNIDELIPRTCRVALLWRVLTKQDQTMTNNSCHAVLVRNIGEGRPRPDCTRRLSSSPVRPLKLGVTLPLYLQSVVSCGSKLMAMSMKNARSSNTNTFQIRGVQCIDTEPKEKYALSVSPNDERSRILNVPRDLRRLEVIWTRGCRLLSTLQSNENAPHKVLGISESHGMSKLPPNISFSLENMLCRVVSTASLGNRHDLSFF